MIMFWSILFFAVATIVCAILGVMGIMPIWMALLCLVVFELIGMVTCIAESVHNIRLYRGWIKKEQARAEPNERNIRDSRSFIEKEKRELRWMPFCMSAIIVLYALMVSCWPIVSIVNWFGDLRKPKNIA